MNYNVNGWYVGYLIWKPMGSEPTDWEPLFYKDAWIAARTAKLRGNVWVLLDLSLFIAATATSPGEANEWTICVCVCKCTEQKSGEGEPSYVSRRLLPLPRTSCLPIAMEDRCIWFLSLKSAGAICLPLPFFHALPGKQLCPGDVPSPS